MRVAYLLFAYHVQVLCPRLWLTCSLLCAGNNCPHHLVAGEEDKACLRITRLFRTAQPGGGSLALESMSAPLLHAASTPMSWKRLVPVAWLCPRNFHPSFLSGKRQKHRIPDILPWLSRVALGSKWLYSGWGEWSRCGLYGVAFLPLC